MDRFSTHDDEQRLLSRDRDPRGGQLTSVTATFFNLLKGNPPQFPPEISCSQSGASACHVVASKMWQNSLLMRSATITVATTTATNAAMKMRRRLQCLYLLAHFTVRLPSPLRFDSLFTPHHHTGNIGVGFLAMPYAFRPFASYLMPHTPDESNPLACP